mmetsp:Transcript_24636/g.39040  ORF Transcript_24636/g.39040 Transcript_24636/m.39040 type:complete len:88 (+) Transcript_24636:121-384(+)
MLYSQQSHSHSHREREGETETKKNNRKWHVFNKNKLVLEKQHKSTKGDCHIAIAFYSKWNTDYKMQKQNNHKLCVLFFRLQNYNKQK